MRLASIVCLLLSGFAACDEPPRTVVPSGPDPRAAAWRACVRASELDGVELETIPGLDLEVEGVRVVTGALGQRGRDQDPPQGCLRFAAVGGALTFGVGLPAEEAWPQAFAAQLSHSMLSGGKEFRALNLGTPFASATDVLGLATRRATTWRPALLVVELDAATLGEATLDELDAPLRALRDAAASIECGVLVAVSQPPEALLAGTPAHDAQRELLLRAAERAGLSAIDLAEAYGAHPPAGPLLAQTAELHLPHATAQAQRWLLETVKQHLFHSGLLGAAIGVR